MMESKAPHPDYSASSQGYICKRCGHAAPLGIGYAAHYPGARQASATLRRCHCGYSQRAR